MGKPLVPVQRDLFGIQCTGPLHLGWIGCAGLNWLQQVNNFQLCTLRAVTPNLFGFKEHLQNKIKVNISYVEKYYKFKLKDVDKFDFLVEHLMNDHCVHVVPGALVGNHCPRILYN